jgi:hypothetical protein
MAGLIHGEAATVSQATAESRGGGHHAMMSSAARR